jgi:hypothetical protein
MVPAFEHFTRNYKEGRFTEIDLVYVSAESNTREMLCWVYVWKKLYPKQCCTWEIMSCNNVFNTNIKYLHMHKTQRAKCDK